MATGNNTAYDIGIRRNVSYNGTNLGERNFEPALCKASPATVQYAVKSNFGGEAINGLSWVDGNVYAPGQLLPYDVGGVSYSTAATSLLNFYWEQGFIVCTS